MTAAETPQPVHPVLRFARELRAEVAGLVERVGFMSVEDTAAALRELHADQAGLDALRLALIAHAERVGVPASEPAGACTSMEAWLRTQLLVAPAEAKRQVKLARQLDDPAHEVTLVALVAGRVDVVASRIIVEAVDALPREVDPAVRRSAESHLVGLAGFHDAGDLRRLAKHLDAVIDPEGADRREADALARAEAKAARQAFCHLWFDEQAQTATGSFKTDLLTGRRLARMLEALMNPGRPDPIPFTDENGNTVSADERRGHALTELIGRIPKTTLPQTGGCDPVVVVTMTLETLTGGAKAAVLDTGERISPAAARRLAARHGVIPAVLGAQGQVLDLGRKTRLFTKTQRIAMNIQQGGTCAAESCQHPAAWADAHHLKPWHRGGPTDLANGVLICPRHHTMADHPDYHTERAGPGRIRIHRRT